MCQALCQVPHALSYVLLTLMEAAEGLRHIV